MKEISFTVNGEDHRIRSAPGREPARVAAHALRHLLHEGRLSAPGTVRLLRRPGGRLAQDHLCGAGREGRRQADRDPRRTVRGGAHPDRPQLRHGGRAAVRLLHPRHRDARQGVAGSQPRRHPRPDRQRSGRAPVPLHRLRQGPRRHRVDGPRPPWRGGPRAVSGRPCRQLLRPLHRRGADPGRPALRRRPRAAGNAARRGGAVAPRPGAGAVDRHEQGERPGGCRSGRHRRGRSRRALVRPGLQRLARLCGGRRGGPVRRRRAGGGRGRRRGDRARGRGAGRGRVRAVSSRCSIPRWRSPTALSQVNPKHPNELSCTRVLRGDADKALAESAHVVSGTWNTQRIEHLYLEPESAVAEPLPDGRLHLYTQGQGVFDDRRQVASFLGEPEERIFVELVPNGGAFGGKEDMSIQAQTSLLARMTGRPVKLTLNREESIRLHPKRHPIKMTYTVGCDERGPSDGGQGASDRRPRRLRLGGLQGAGARRRPRLRALQGGQRRRRVARRLHQQPAVRGDARLRRQPGPLRHGRGAGPAGREGRPRRLGDPLAQRAGGGRHVLHRPGVREVGRSQADARRR